MNKKYKFEKEEPFYSKYLCKVVIAFFVIACLGSFTKSYSKESTLSELVNQYDRMDKEQKDTLDYICSASSSDNLCYSARAQAWEESVAGLLPINPADPSFGLFHKVVKNSPREATKLVVDNDYSIKVYLTDMRKLKSICDGSYSCMYGSYNGGVTGYKKHKKNINSKIARYILRINEKIRALQIIDSRI